MKIPHLDPDDQQQILQDTQTWLERAVIGLNLCPYAKAVHVQKRIHYCITGATSPAQLLHVLAQEADRLHHADPKNIETSLIIHPDTLRHFDDFVAFLDPANQQIHAAGYEGLYQLAHFHPEYQFTGSGFDDIENYTNRAPYPTLHLIREDSIARAVASLNNPDSIYERNIATLQKMGIAGWKALFKT